MLDGRGLLFDDYSLRLSYGRMCVETQWMRQTEKEFYSICLMTVRISGKNRRSVLCAPPHEENLDTALTIHLSTSYTYSVCVCHVSVCE